MTARPAKPRLDALTGLRAIAAVHVVAYHHLALALAGAPWWARNVLSGGDAAVSLFFILSGFVLTYTYADGAGRWRARDFWGSRIARLYPVYLLAFVVIAPFTVAGLSEQLGPPAALAKTVAYGVPVLTMTQAWLWQTANKWNYPAWSLSAEAFFYLLFPALVAWLAGRRSRLGWGALGASVAGLWLLSLAAPLAYVAFDPDGLRGTHPGYDGPWLSTIAYNPLLHLPVFLIGVLTGLVFVQRASAGGAGGAGQGRRNSPARAGAALALASAVVIVAAFGAGEGLLPVPLLHNGVLAPLFAALIYALATGGGPVGWVLRRPALLLLGEASYAFYILQEPVWRWTVAGASRISGDEASLASSPGFLAVYFVALTGAAVLAWYLVERPARGALRRVLARRPQTHRPVTALGGTPLRPVVGR